jgi:SAM-dependent MidA family methyltransferase
VTVPDDLLEWSVAWERAAFGPHGFYRRPGTVAEGHFATNITDGPRTAERIATLARDRLDALLSAHAVVTVTDVGAGNGVLLRQLMLAFDPLMVRRLRWRAVDLRLRPAGLPDTVEWIRDDARDIRETVEPGPGLLIAHELLDDVPCPILEVDHEGHWRQVLVDPHTGSENLGAVVADESWCEAWWSRREPAARIEVGRSRDDTWRRLTGLIDQGLAVAVDYGHVTSERASGMWDGGTIAAYRGGRLVSAIPDGTRNITAHVAMDSCAAAVDAPLTELTRGSHGLWWLVHEMAR